MNMQFKPTRHKTSKDIWREVAELGAELTFTLGSVNTNTWVKDPKHMGFMLARYKFAAKMSRQCKTLLEIGCGEGLGTWLLHTETKADILAIDFDEKQIEYARTNVAVLGDNKIEFSSRTISEIQQPSFFDGVIALDVIEHIETGADEAYFLSTCSQALGSNGIFIIGTPNLNASLYASEASKIGHINLFNPTRFSTTLEQYFNHVFLFSMNDEVVHTGFSEMAHYLMAVCVK